MREKWKKIPGWPSYSASTLGRIKRDVLREGGRGKPGLVVQGLRFGYPIVKLNEIYKCKKKYPVHHLILETFVGPRPKEMETRHLNDIRNDNRLVNLKWGTHKENCQDRKNNGTLIGLAALSKKERSIAAQKSADTRKRKGIKFGFAVFSYEERQEIFRKRSENIKKKGIKMGMATLSKKERIKVAKKIMKTRIKNHGY